MVVEEQKKLIAGESMDFSCQQCGDDCETWEIVDTGFCSKDELWCYCKKCDVETFKAIAETLEGER